MTIEPLLNSNNAADIPLLSALVVDIPLRFLALGALLGFFSFASTRLCVAISPPRATRANESARLGRCGHSEAEILEGNRKI